MTTRIKLRRDSATNRENANPVLALGEAGYDTTNNQIRVGDGTSYWSDLSPIGGAGGGNIASPNGDYIMWLNNNGELVAGPGGNYDIQLGPVQEGPYSAGIYISQDGPYIRSEVRGTTNQNYANDMLWHDAWFSRYNKVTTDAYGVHIKNAQWYGPANNYRNEWTFTKDGIFDLPPRAEIRVNPIPPDTSYNSPYWAVDQSLTLTANTVTISGGRLDVGGGQRDGFVAVLGPMPNGNNDVWYETITTDPGGNIYAAGGSYINTHNTIVTKFDPDGNVLWNKYLTKNSSSWTGEPANIEFVDAGIGQFVFVTSNDYTGQNYFGSLVLVADTGNALNFGGGNAGSTVTNSEPYNIEAIDSAVPYALSGDPSLAGNPVVVGRRANGQYYITPDVTGITQTTSNRLVVNASTFAGNLYPDASQNAWNMYGTDITGNVSINNINNFTGLTATRVSGTGTGTDATFAVSYTPGGTYQVAISSGGTNYADDDVLTITGDHLGGATTTNDLTFHVTTDTGAVVGVNTISGTATGHWALGILGDPVDFTSIATPTILAYTNTDGFLTFGANTAIMGNVSWDVINTVVCESGTSSNVYFGGRTHAQGYTTSRQAFIAKYNLSTKTVLWSRVVDDYHAQGGAQQGGDVHCIASDSTSAVISVADNTHGGITITKVDHDGTMVWQRILTLYGPDIDQTYGIAVGDDDSLLVTGRAQSEQEFNNYDMLITKIDKNGNQLWTRAFGTLQNDGSWWDYNFRDIVVQGDYFMINGWTNGAANQRSNNSNGYVAKFNLDGSGIGRYGDFYYSTLDGSTYFETVSNTAANAFTISMRDVTSTAEAFNFGNGSDFDVANEDTYVYTLRIGGPGFIDGVGGIKYLTETVTTSTGQVTEIDLTKTINKLTPTGGSSTSNGVYHLANGFEGQIMHLVPQGGISPSNEYTGINFDNCRYRQGNTFSEGSGNYWLPFAGPIGSTGYPIVTLIFTDGHWNLPHNNFD